MHLLPVQLGSSYLSCPLDPLDRQAIHAAQQFQRLVGSAGLWWGMAVDACGALRGQGVGAPAPSLLSTMGFPKSQVSGFASCQLSPPWSSALARGWPIPDKIVNGGTLGCLCSSPRPRFRGDARPVLERCLCIDRPRLRVLHTAGAARVPPRGPRQKLVRYFGQAGGRFMEAPGP
jgi:hypothetical protein